MKIEPTAGVSRVGAGGFAAVGRKAAVSVVALVVMFLAGCASPVATMPLPAKTSPDVQTLNPGDVVRISFPGAQNLDTTQQIRRDGRINLYMIGEIKVADKSPADFERELVQAYSSQLVSKEIKVTVVSSSFSVFVTGAVVKPGKIMPDRALTAFDAIMEAGGFDNARAAEGCGFGAANRGDRLLLPMLLLFRLREHGVHRSFGGCGIGSAEPSARSFVVGRVGGEERHKCANQ